MKTFRTRGTLAAAALLSVLTALAGCGASASSTGSLGGMQANPLGSNDHKKNLRLHPESNLKPFSLR